ncbi:MAG: prepilin-type N-terminal cleavage/methylation domain-containing protein [Planctomycetes bacterium]|nr:prepilin-type N-terminal cleavage/methylation domain-containing protein [Planctomycetota bacterium]
MPTLCCSASRGFTLLELMIVIGVVSVLMGFALGFVGKVDPNLVAASVLAGERRSAQLTARAEGVPTEVVLRPGVGNQAATVQSRLLQPVMTWHFEPGQEYLDDALRPTLGGSDVPNGRFGHARRPRAGDRDPLLQWQLTPAAADLRDGFLVRVDLWCDERDHATLLRLPPTLDLQVDEQLRPRARFKVQRQGDSGPVSIGVGSELALPVRRWCTLDIGCDGQHAWLSLDGRELGRTVADGGPQQDEPMPLVVSPPDAPWPGMIDELRLYVFTYSPPQMLPIQLQPAQVYRFGYDQNGEALAEPAVRYLTAEELQ